MNRLLLLLALCLLAGCSGSETEPPRTALGDSVQGYVGGGGVELELPEGWQRVSAPAGSVTDPVVRLAVSSAPLQPRDSRCQIADFAPADGAVAVVIVEWRRIEARGKPRPERFDQRALPIRRGLVECHPARGGAFSFVENGRSLAVYVLFGRAAPTALEPATRRLLQSLRVAAQLPTPVRLVHPAPETQAHCRRSPLLRPICPTLVPRVRAPYLSHLAQEVAGRISPLDVFDLERGGEIVGEPERNRPPRMAHIALLAGETERIAGWREPWQTPARPLRDGLMQTERTAPVSFGLFGFGETRGLLFLAPPFPQGGYLGNHLVFVWRDGPISRAVTIHGWEPLREAAATLRQLALSAPIIAGGAQLDARTDSDGVLYVDGSGWTCGNQVQVVLTGRAEITVRPDRSGVFHRRFPPHAGRWASGRVVATQPCAGALPLRRVARIAAG